MNKVVCLLSSMHKTVSVDQAHGKKLSETVKYYNWSKVGVDVFDQMARYHTCKSATRRWPVAVFFFNIIDCTCINAYIIYSEVTNQSTSRREILLLLIKEMCGESLAESTPALPSAPTATSEASRESRKGQQCQPHRCRNKSTPTCHMCRRPCCDNHTSSKVIVATCSSSDEYRTFVSVFLLLYSCLNNIRS